VHGVHSLKTYTTYQSTTLKDNLLFRCLDSQILKTILYNFNITLSYIANTIQWRYNGTLVLYFTFYNLAKLCANTLYVF
jgi:hypothetical protein